MNMADDLSLLVGEIRGATKALTERMDRSDDQTDAKFQALDTKMESNKNEAIAARDAKHDENKGELRSLREAMDGTAVIARDSAYWIKETGAALVVKVDNIHDRVTAIEDGRRVKAAEERGQAKTWGIIGGAAVTGGGFIAGLLEYWHVIVDFLKGLGRG